MNKTETGDRRYISTSQTQTNICAQTGKSTAANAS